MARTGCDANISNVCVAIDRWKYFDISLKTAPGLPIVP